MFARCVSILLFLGIISAGISDSEWPQHLGPKRDGHYRGPSIIDTFPGSGPRLVWEESLGEGFAGPVVDGEKVVLFHRAAGESILACFHTQTGRLLWEDKQRATYKDDFGFEQGPRATPTIHHSRVYALGADGLLRCVDMLSGKRIWSVDLKKTFGASKGFFGFAGSPLAVGERLYLNVGGTQMAGIVALRADTGALEWKATGHEASYSSPILGEIGGRSSVVVFSREGLVVLDPKVGKVWHEFPWRARMNASVNAATPLLIGDRVFVSASYRVGGALVDLGGEKPRTIWEGDSMSNHYATCVFHEGFLYGFHGRQESGCALRCIEAGTGKTRWTESSFGAGSIIVAGDSLVILKESGELVLATASPDSYRQQASAQVLGNQVRAYAALANGIYFARDKKRLVALDLLKR
jgi:outer membrane protein assembly factor BamB